METKLKHQNKDLYLPLKPSLVEWKPVSFTSDFTNVVSLETFLSGMETCLLS